MAGPIGDFPPETIRDQKRIEFEHEKGTANTERLAAEKTRKCRVIRGEGGKKKRTALKNGSQIGVDRQGDECNRIKYPGTCSGHALVVGNNHGR